MPPISRIEDRTQTRKCVRLRRGLKRTYADVLPAYNQVCTVVKGFSEQTDLEKYYDIYDISDFDMSDALLGFTEEEFDDPESLRTLKILAARFYTIRKLFLCALLALDANDDANDLLRWTTAVEALGNLNRITHTAYDRIKTILSEEECKEYFPNWKVSLSSNIGSIPNTAKPQASFDTKQRALAISTSKTQFTLDRHPRLAGQAPTST